MDPAEPTWITELWTEMRPIALARAEEIAASVDRLTTECPTSDPDWQQAKMLSHGLAGSLGMYGFPRGSEIAQELFRVLEAMPLDLPGCRQLADRLRTEIADGT